MAPDISSREKRPGEAGNAFFIVMVGVVLFGALMFTFSRGARQGGDNLTLKQAEIEAADVITYAQKVERGVQRVYGRGFSENSISFQNTFFSGNENGACTDGRCAVFRETGGGVNYKPLEPGWSLTANHWIFTGDNQVVGIGRDCASNACSELLMMIENMPESLCVAINEQIGLTADGALPPTDANVDTVLFTSVFSYNAGAIIGDSTPALAGQRTACLRETGSGFHYFYHVLLER